MSSKKYRKTLLNPLYINGINSNNILNIKINKDSAFITYYGNNTKDVKTMTISNTDPVYNKLETYMYRYNRSKL
jgi:hypothetical protein